MRPSTRLSSAGEQLTIIAKHRSESPERLHKLLRGDLDWIVMKALDKDRNRRYDTAKGFINDLRKHLSQQPVEAGPPSATYRIQKFCHRNSIAVIAGALVAVTLVSGLAAATAGFVHARRERAMADKSRAEAAREAKKAGLVNAALRDLLGTAHPTVDRGRDYTARQMIDDFVAMLAVTPPDDPEVEADIHFTVGEAYRSLGEKPKAQASFSRSLKLRREALGNENEEVAECLRELSRVTGDLKLAREALQIHRELGVESEAHSSTVRVTGRA